MAGNDQALLEVGVNPDTARKLQARGHRLGVVTGRQRVSIGGAQVIMRDHQTGVLQGGAEPRKAAAVG